MKTLEYLVVLFLITLVSCKNDTISITTNIDYSHLNKNWYHSFEEDDHNNYPVMIFRPSNYKEYQPSHYREKIEFKIDGKCNFLVLDPSDAHFMDTGEWKIFDYNNNIVKIFKSSGSSYKTFQILELKKDILKFKIIY